MGKKWMTWFLGGVWFLGVLLALIWKFGAMSDAAAVTPTTSPTPPSATPTADELLASVALRNYDGPASAPVKLVVFSDFDCTFCKAWRIRDLRATLRAEFGDQLAVVGHVGLDHTHNQIGAVLAGPSGSVDRGIDRGQEGQIAG